MIRNWVLGAITLALASGLGLTVPPSPAQADSPCNREDPPSWCFEEPTEPGDPYGTVKFRQDTSGVVAEGTAGETFGGPVWVDVRVDGVRKSTVTPSNSGYYYSYVFVSLTTKKVCASARNFDGYSVELGCYDVHGPVGKVESATDMGSAMVVTGWVADPDSTEPVVLRVHVGYTGTSSDYVANQPRSDIAAQYPAYGPYHGFSLVLSNDHCYVITALNVGPGVNTALFDTCLT